MSAKEITVGTRVRGYDEAYDLHYEGLVVNDEWSQGGRPFLVVDNETPGPFEGQFVGLPVRDWEVVA